MKTIRYLIILLPLIATLSCLNNSPRKKLIDHIKICESKIYKDSLATIPDEKTGLEAVQAYADFANAFPKDTLSAEYLFKGAEIAMNLNKSAMAIETYNRILLNYPDFSKRPLCIFLQAFILENQMNMYDQAKARYQEFLDKYPEHVLAKDARASIDNMGKPVEELIKQWESKNSR